MNRRGILIALSGVDCAGKSTQRALLLETLRAWGYAPVTIWTRLGYTPGMEAAKRVLRALVGRKKESARHAPSKEPGRYPRRATDLSNPFGRRLWLTGALLELLWVFAVRIRLWKARGRVVVCDRYLLDCLVDLRVNFPSERIEERRLARWLRGFSVRPDAAWCLMVEPEQTLERSRRKSRHHWETLDVLRRRWCEYETLSRNLCVAIVDGTRPAGELARSLRQRLAAILPVAEPSRTIPPETVESEPVGRGELRAR